MSSNTRNLSSICSFEEAAYIWGQQEKPRGRDWQDHQRPIGSNRQHHYRLENHGSHFDVCLYRTVMARYHRPQGDTNVVEYAGDDSVTSKQFMHYVLNHGRLASYGTTDGKVVIVPTSTSRRLTTRLVFVRGKLDVSQSDHPPAYVYHMSDEMKQTRQELWAEMHDMIELMMLRIPYLQNTMYGVVHRNPFDRAELPLLKRHYRTQEFGKAFVEFGDAVFQRLLDSEARSTSLVNGDVKVRYRTALKRALAREFDLDKRNKRVALPKFASVGHVPNSAVCIEE